VDDDVVKARDRLEVGDQFGWERRIASKVLNCLGVVLESISAPRRQLPLRCR
jgi:hypothetical protein